MYYKYFFVLLLTLFCMSCSDDPTSSEEIKTGTVTDIDGNVYQTIRIGNQWWMAENLKVVHYLNGEAIANVTEDTTWANLSSGAWCSYDNDAGNVSTYGLFYNWYAVDDSSNIAPAGWHVPSYEEIQTLETFVGYQETKLIDENAKSGYTFTNETGFSALFAGNRYNGSRSFSDLSYNTYFWSSTEIGSYAKSVRLNYGSSGVNFYDDYKNNGFSVRCLKD